MNPDTSIFIFILIGLHSLCQNWSFLLHLLNCFGPVHGNVNCCSLHTCVNKVIWLLLLYQLLISIHNLYSWIFTTVTKCWLSSLGCANSMYGCCPDGSSAAQDWNFRGCPGMLLLIFFLSKFALHNFFILKLNPEENYFLSKFFVTCASGWLGISWEAEILIYLFC